MRFGKILAAASATALTLCPVAAQASLSPAAYVMRTSKSVAPNSVKRAGVPAGVESKMGGDSTMLLILAVILIGAGIFVLADNEDDTPTSP